MLCSFFNKDGEPLESSPEHTLHKACKAFTDVTGMEFQLEYYVISPDTGMFQVQINVVIMNLLRMLSLTISVHSVCRI